MYIYIKNQVYFNNCLNKNKIKETNQKDHNKKIQTERRDFVFTTTDNKIH